MTTSVNDILCPKCHAVVESGDKILLRAEVRNRICPVCKFPVFLYICLQLDHVEELRGNKDLVHLLKPDNCEKFMEWIAEKAEKKKNPHGFKFV